MDPQGLPRSISCWANPIPGKIEKKIARLYQFIMAISKKGAQGGCEERQ